MEPEILDPNHSPRNWKRRLAAAIPEDLAIRSNDRRTLNAAIEARRNHLVVMDVRLSAPPEYLLIVDNAENNNIDAADWLVAGVAIHGTESAPGYNLIFRCGAVPALDWSPARRIARRPGLDLPERLSRHDPRFWSVETDIPASETEHSRMLLSAVLMQTVSELDDLVSANHPPLRPELAAGAAEFVAEKIRQFRLLKPPPD